MKATKNATATRPLELNLTSTIDVVFLLLTFFVFTSDFKEPEKLLPTNLAQSGAVQTSDAVPQEERDLGRIVVKIDVKNGALAWRVDSRPAASLEEVAALFEELRRIDPNVPTIIDPTSAVPIENVLDVYDVARGVGLSKIKFAASPNALAGLGGGK
ncbi:MAG: biopolymer transporter ExbD [Thermoguttaceae bacterium]|nr:biopolymer transporter ExbD [Thermoguttaceae bacterium]